MSGGIRGMIFLIGRTTDTRKIAILFKGSRLRSLPAAAFANRSQQGIIPPWDAVNFLWPLHIPFLPPVPESAGFSHLHVPHAGGHAPSPKTSAPADTLRDYGRCLNPCGWTMEGRRRRPWAPPPPKDLRRSGGSGPATPCLLTSLFEEAHGFRSHRPGNQFLHEVPGEEAIVWGAIDACLGKRGHVLSHLPGASRPLVDGRGSIR